MSRFRWLLAGVLGVAFVIRLVYALKVAPGVTFLDDDNFYHLTANALADGLGYVRPLDLVLEGRELPTAEHPPLYPMLLAAVSWLGGTGLDAHRLVNVVCGTATVLVIALIARRLAGDRAALVAAGLAAVYPSFIAADGAIMSETLLGLLVGLVVLQALRVHERPTAAGFVLLGALVGLAILTRSETLLLLPFVTIPAVIAAPRRRFLLAATAVLAAALVLAPWVVRNWTAFDRPLISTNDGTTLAGSNCRETYYGGDIGWFVFDCALEDAGATGNEAERFARLRERGLEYMTENPGRAVVVTGVRVLSLWGVWEPSRQNVVTGRALRVQQAGVVIFYLVAVLAAVALWRRRGAILAILLSPLIVATLAAMATYGGPRLRHGAEVVLIALAGVTLAAVLSRRRASAA